MDEMRGRELAIALSQHAAQRSQQPTPSRSVSASPPRSPTSGRGTTFLSASCVCSQWTTDDEPGVCAVARRATDQAAHTELEVSLCFYYLRRNLQMNQTVTPNVEVVDEVGG